MEKVEKNLKEVNEKVIGKETEKVESKVSIKYGKTTIDDFWHCPVIEVETKNENGLIPFLNNYDNNSIEALPRCNVVFSKEVNSYGQTIYTAVATIGGLEETFSSRDKKRDPLSTLDNINYDLINARHKVSPTSYNNFTLKLPYRLSIGTSSLGKKFLLLEIVCCRYNENSRIILQKSLSLRRRATFESRPQWFKGVNPIVVYSRGSIAEDNVIEADEDESSVW